MNEQRLIEALRQLDRYEAPSPEFADRLFDQLIGARRQAVAPLAPRRQLAIIAAVLALAALGLAIAAGSELLRQRPALTLESPAPSGAPSRTARLGEQSWVFRSNPSGPRLRIHGVLPPGNYVHVGEDSRYFSLTIGDKPYGFSSASASAPVGRGVRIIDAATVRPHFNNNAPLGEDAAAFMDGLQTNPILGDVIGPIRLTTIAGLPALTADLLPGPNPVHMDTAHGLSVDLWPPSRLIVADLGSAIVLVHVWADSDEGLASWLDESQPFIESLRIEAVTAPAPS